MSSTPAKPTWRSGYYGKLKPARVLALRAYIADQRKHMETVAEEVVGFAKLEPTPANLTQLMQRSNYLRSVAHNIWGYASPIEYYDAEGKFKRT